MKKLVTLAIMSALMLVNGREPQPSGPELFTLRRFNFYEATFAYMRQPEPTQVTGAAITSRRHFGYPCYALIVDKSHAGNLYAKLDAIRLIVNAAVAALAGLMLVNLPGAIKRLVTTQNGFSMDCKQ